MINLQTLLNFAHEVIAVASLTLAEEYEYDYRIAEQIQELANVFLIECFTNMKILIDHFARRIRQQRRLAVLPGQTVQDLNEIQANCDYEISSMIGAINGRLRNDLTNFFGQLIRYCSRVNALLPSYEKYRSLPQCCYSLATEMIDRHVLGQVIEQDQRESLKESIDEVFNTVAIQMM